MSLTAKIEEETMRSESLKATLAMLKKGEAVVEEEETPAQTKAKMAMKIIDLQEKQFKLEQSMAKKEMDKKHLDMMLKEEDNELKKVNELIEEERSKGKAVWETVGIKTIPYRDPFHTGLMKRMPTGGFFTS